MHYLRYAAEHRIYSSKISRSMPNFHLQKAYDDASTRKSEFTSCNWDLQFVAALHAKKTSIRTTIIIVG